MGRKLIYGNRCIRFFILPMEPIRGFNVESMQTESGFYQEDLKI